MLPHTMEDFSSTHRADMLSIAREYYPRAKGKYLLTSEEVGHIRALHGILAALYEPYVATMRKIGEAF